MKQIDPRRLQERLYSQRLRYLSELNELAHGENEAFANDDETCFALVHQYPYGPCASFTGYDPAFFEQVLHRYPSLNLNISLPPGQALRVEPMRGLTQNGSYEYFAYEGEPPTAPIDPRVRLLAKEEHELVRPIMQHDAPILNDPEALIFVCFDAEQIVGYLSCSPEWEDVWDAGNVFTLPEHRGKGIGTALDYAYLKTMRERGFVPYGSGVYNPASAAAARKAGFELCCVRHAFNYKRPKLFRRRT